MTIKKKHAGGRPPKPKGTRVKDFLHIGLRFTPTEREMMETVLSHKTEQMKEIGVSLKGVTISSLAKVWISERLLREHKLAKEPAEHHLEDVAGETGGQ